MKRPTLNSVHTCMSCGYTYYGSSTRCPQCDSYRVVKGRAAARVEREENEANSGDKR